MAKQKTETVSNAGKDAEKLDLSYITGGNVKWYGSSGKQFDIFFKKNKNLLCDPITTLLGIYSREMKTDIHTKTCLQMLTEALFILVPNWKQSRCPSIGEWLQKLVHPFHGTLIFSSKKKIDY